MTAAAILLGAVVYFRLACAFGRFLGRNDWADPRDVEVFLADHRTRETL